MPRVATSDELDLFRSDGQAAKLFAAFFVPNIIFSAQLASVPSTTDQIAQISYTAGSGVLANVKPDMLLKVGSTAGGQELGYARIRKAPISGTFYIGEQSIINWGASSPVYLTVVDDYDLWSKHVRIDGTTIYMDYDIAFSDQHTTFSPVPVLGPVVSVLKLVEGTGTVKVGPESGYHSWVIGSTIVSRLWSTPSSGVSFSSTTVESPTLTITTPGWKLLYCTVSAGNGKTHQGMRYVYVYDEDNPPLSVFTLGENSEDSKQGGCNFTLVFSDSAPLTTIPDRALCVLFAEDYYGAGNDQQQISIGAVEGRENVIYTGRVIAESLSYDEETQTASIEIQGYQELMKRIHGFPAGLRFKITPEVWTDMPAMTVDRALYHLLEYHTTAITIMDFNRTGDTRYTAQAFSPFSNIWEQMREFAEKQILANAFVDHLGRLFFEIDPLLLPVADRNYPVVMTLTDADLTGRVELPREVLSEVGQINLSGVVIDGGGNATAFFSLSPGHIHDRTGRVEIADRLLLEDQTQANETAGLLFAAKNNPYKPMRLKFKANNRLLTCFPNQAIAYTIAAANNARGFAITKNWIPRQRKLSYDPETGQLSVEFIVEAETVPMHAIVGDVPGSDTGFSFPPLPGLPPLPSIPVILPGGVPPGSDGGPKKVLVHSSNAGLMRCDNFDADENEQEWYLWNAGLSTLQAQRINRIVVCPNGAIYVTRRGGGFTPGSNDDTYLYRAPYAGGTFVMVENLTTMRSKMGLGGSSPAWVGGINCNRLAPEDVLYTLYDGSQLWVFTGSGSTFTHTGLKLTTGTQDASTSYGFGKWRISGGGISAAKLWILSPDGTTLLVTKSYPTDLKAAEMKHVGISTSDKLYLTANLSDQTISLVADNGNTITQDIGDLYANGVFITADEEAQFAIDPSGQTIMTTRATTHKGRSLDYGATLSDITNLPTAFFQFAWAGGVGSVSRWIAVGSYLYYTDDYWNSTPIDKRGNILDLDPILALTNVRVLEM